MIEQTVQTFLVAVLTGLVYAGVQGTPWQSKAVTGETDMEKGLQKGVPVESLRNIRVVVQGQEPGPQGQAPMPFHGRGQEPVPFQVVVADEEHKDDLE